MNSPIDQISVPVMTPGRPSISTPLTSTPAVRSQEEVEADFDKFATLFSPPTPRASPSRDIGEPLWPSSSQDPKATPPLMTPDSEFGAFVSVPASHHPLAPQASSPTSSNDSPRKSYQKSHGRNISMDFFDKFTQGAKTATTERNRGLLDEILAHEDDPLFRPAFEKENIPSYSLSDFDPLNNDHHAKDSHPTAAIPQHSPPSDSPHLPRRLPSLSTIAAPIVASPSPHIEHGERPTSHSRSTSYQTLSTLSSWLNPVPEPQHLPSQSHLPPARISHGTPFAPSLPEGAAAPAPSGAPGFQPSRYERWDKGFSESLEKDHRVDPFPAEIQTEPVSRLKFIEKTGGHVDLKGRREMTDTVLTLELANLIRTYLPALSRLPRAWNLVYSLDQHGVSLKTLYTRCETANPRGYSSSKGSILAVKDSSDSVFGVYIGEGLRESKGAGYYGGGDSFLWTYKNKELKVSKWTGRNDYVALCEQEYLGFGGGDGHYGLYLDSALNEGSSATCITFNNEPLCTLPVSPTARKRRDVDFQCVGLEVWGVGG